jgi:hypothetical protein
MRERERWRGLRNTAKMIQDEERRNEPVVPRGKW